MAERGDRGHISTLMGNHDDHAIIPLEKHSAAERTARIRAIEHTRETISPENCEYLAALPRSLRISFGTGRSATRILLVMQVRVASMNREITVDVTNDRNSVHSVDDTPRRQQDTDFLYSDGVTPTDLRNAFPKWLEFAKPVSAAI
jgi:hypothetical protein